MRVGRWKYIEMKEEGRRELYDLVMDPGEQSDLSDRQSGRAQELSALVAEWRVREEQKSSRQAFEVSPQDREAMRALGYTD